MTLYLLGMLSGLAFAAACGAGALSTLRDARRTDAAQRGRAVSIAVTCPFPLDSGSGSGVVIGPHHVLTAAHVPQCRVPGGKVVIRDPHGVYRDAMVEVVSLEADIARLRVAGPPMDAPPVEIAPVMLGQRVCLVTSAPVAGRSCGYIDGITDGGPGNVMHSATTVPGNSGSGAYDSAGRLIGIVTHRRINSEGKSTGGKFSSIFKRGGLL